LSNTHSCDPLAPTPRPPLSLHDALPISPPAHGKATGLLDKINPAPPKTSPPAKNRPQPPLAEVTHGRAKSPEEICGVSARMSKRSEEHTSELQSLAYLVCRLLLEKKNDK